MPLVDSRHMLADAQKNGYAIAAFNIENMEMAQAVTDAARELKAPVILQTTSSTLRYANPTVFAAMVRALAERVSVPVVMHLDHGDGYALAAQAAQGGYTSLMIDGSALPFEDNIAVTNKVRTLGLPVEAELGSIGGKEDDTEGRSDSYTDPEQAADFVRQTRVDSLAVAIGTAHGVYAKAPCLDIERLKSIRQKTTVPLVLHGASGLTDEVVRECIREGIGKVNFATELRIAYSDGVKACIKDNPGVFDPKAYGKRGYALVKVLVMEKIRLCGAEGRV
jgi:tagatose 1,6-diphosphate aldolase GatY/KbaY